jgi:hypothetical protein
MIPEIKVASRHACALACRLCAEECEMHASNHEHCRIWAEHCHRCEQTCKEVVQPIPELGALFGADDEPADRVPPATERQGLSIGDEGR